MAAKPIRVAVLRFLWAPGPPVPDEQAHATWPDELFHEVFQNGNGWSIRDYWLRSSFGLLQLEFDFTISTWWRLADRTHAQLRTDRAGILAACRRVVEQDNGISLSAYDHVVAFVHAPPINAGAIGIGDGASLDQGGTIPFFQHEIGHVLGFQHAFGPFVPPPSVFGSLYNDPYDVMGFTGTQAHAIPAPSQFAQTTILQGASFWQSERRASAAALYRRFTGSADFVDSGWVANVATGQRVWIGALSEVDNTTPVIAVLPISDGRLVTIEYRTNTADDAGVTPAVVVHSIGAHDVGTGRTEMNPPWFEGTIAPQVGASLNVLGVKIEITTLYGGTPAGVEVELTEASLDPMRPVQDGISDAPPHTTTDDPKMGDVQEGLSRRPPRVGG
jgi:hypothetical protein